MLQLKEKKKSELTISIVLTVLLLAFLGLVFYVNLSCNPEYYDRDMYSDMNYAKEAWKAKSFFPKEWVFGNQTYIVATPALVAVIYGICGDVVIAMGTASCIMSVLVFLSYDWMMKAYCSYNERTAGFLFMVSFIIAKAHIAVDDCGAQILFTMASYYACYVITAFLTYGVYVREKNNLPIAKYIPIYIITIVLSFATGIQSLRQALIMALPLMFAEICFVIIELIKSKKIKSISSVLYSCLIFFANIAGYVVSKFMDYKQTTIYGKASFNFDLSKIKNSIPQTIRNMIDNYSVYYFPSIISHLVAAAMFAIVIIALILAVKNYVRSKEKNISEVALLLLLLLGSIDLIAVGALTNMRVRVVYYIMMFPLAAVSFTVILRALKGKIKKILYIMLAAVAVISFGAKGITTYREIENGKLSSNPIIQAEKYMTENGYDTVYSLYSGGGAAGISIASGDRIKVLGFKDNFEPINYLCVEDSYKKANKDKTLYLIKKSEMQSSVKIAKKYNVKFEKMAELDENMVLCRASENLPVVVSQSNNK